MVSTRVLLVSSCAALILGGTASCATPRAPSGPSLSEQAVRKRAAFDLACASQEITIVQLSDPERIPSKGKRMSRGSWGATGCGQRASYLAECTTPLGAPSACTAVLNSPIQGS
ncbi:MAG: hypothetical protein IT383_09725 [Deltaproteobacteria bacterium]|nr:hypothetical protein [Deltaproteobacteria bacterium]